MKKILKVVLIIAVATTILGYFAHKIYQAVSPNYTYENAIQYTYNDKIYKESYIIRDEEIILSNARGVRSYTVQNGTRVSNGSSILNIYENEAEAAYASQINELEKEIKMLESIETASASTGELESAQRSLDEELKELSKNIEKKDFESLQELKTNILYSLNKKQVILGDEADFSERINSLKSQKEEVEARRSDIPITIKSPGTGYFISDIDGRESFIEIEDALKLTPSGVEDLFSREPEEIKENAIGKLVKKYHWYIVMEMNASEVHKIKERKSLKINIPSVSLEDVIVPIAAINYSKTGEKAAVILKCGYMSTDLSTLRTAQIEVNLATHSGIRINNKSIHFKGDEKGVYVLSGSQLHFKKVDVTYQGNGYIISKEHNEGDYVTRHDQVITSGKDLYDGKLVR
jgi:hypothetical protein